MKTILETISHILIQMITLEIMISVNKDNYFRNQDGVLHVKLFTLVIAYIWVDIWYTFSIFPYEIKMVSLIHMKLARLYSTKSTEKISSKIYFGDSGYKDICFCKTLL